MAEYRVGQRWISETEPELGLGTIESASRHQIEVVFSASAERRIYAAGNAPIQRVAFRAGDSVRLESGESVQIDSVREEDGLFLYLCDGEEVPESALADTLSFSKPEDRLIMGQADDSQAFSLRLEANRRLAAAKQSPVSGFIGGRIDLIPHQMYIASEVSQRLLPRVLLADEVGLGKTIEACLILHRLHLNGRASRILILLPESLLHQWFVELLRRFNLWFELFDAERCATALEADPQANPFLDQQLLLCPIDGLAKNESWSQLCAEAGWDLLVVDEAHHLEWSPEVVSPEYQLVESISRRSTGLLLLTATPEQLGADGHFARLRLLDSDRYPDLEHFREEQSEYAAAAGLAEQLLARDELETASRTQLREIFTECDDPAFEALLQDRAAMLSQLIDRHGPGRVLFRNTRDALEGFPVRKALPCPIEPRETISPEELEERLLLEYELDDSEKSSPELDYRKGSRIHWLAELLRELSGEKVLLICRSQEKVLAIHEALAEQINVKAAVFHEGLSLVQRDRNAAWFAEPEGARILICSEIGSEGRNFQFAHHLVLFDLPLDPELVEQRIGRLDRIGQTETIRIYAPYLKGASTELLFRWHQEGLNGLEHSLRGGSAYLDSFGGQVRSLGASYHLAETANRQGVDQLIDETRGYREELEQRLSSGQDKLIALNSCRAGVADALLEQICQTDADRSLDTFMNRVFDYFGVSVEDIDERTLRLSSGSLFTESFPGIPDGGITITFDRQTALQREDITFLTWDHPMARGAIDLLVGSSKGNSGLVVWENPPEAAPPLLVEAVYILESVAPAQLHIERFLPPTPVRVCVDPGGDDFAGQFASGWIDSRVRDEESFRIQQDPELLRGILPPLLEKAREHARKARESILVDALHLARASLESEAERLESLSQVNPNVRAEEIRLAREQVNQTAKQIAGAHLRLDAVRLILHSPG
jgi:ATP-dependent helicase HepA